MCTVVPQLDIKSYNFSPLVLWITNMTTVFGDTVNLSTLSSTAFLKRHETQTSSGSKVVSYSHDLGQGPVLWLVHGYPQSSYMYAEWSSSSFVILTDHL